MDVGGGQAGRVGPGKEPQVKVVDIVDPVERHRAAEMDRAGDQAAQDLQAAPEISGGPADDHQRVGRQRFGVDGGDEQRRRGGGNGRDPAEGAGPQAGPEAGGDQGRAHVRRCQGLWIVPRMVDEDDVLLPVNGDHQRQKAPLGAAVDLDDGAAAGRGVDDIGIVLVGEQHLADLDPIALADGQGRSDADAVVPEQGDAADIPSRPDFLHRSPGYRDIQPLLDADMIHMRLYSCRLSRTSKKRRGAVIPESLLENRVVNRIS